MFQKGHGRKNYKVIKTDLGYYAAFVAGLNEWTDNPLKARMFESQDVAEGYYSRSLRRAKGLPTARTIESVKLSEGRDQNR